MVKKNGVTFGCLVGELDAVLKDGDGEVIAWHGTQEQSEVLVNVIGRIRAAEVDDDLLQSRKPRFRLFSTISKTASYEKKKKKNRIPSDSSGAGPSHQSLLLWIFQQQPWGLDPDPMKWLSASPNTSSP